MERQYNGIVEGASGDALLEAAEEALATGRPPVLCPDCGNVLRLEKNPYKAGSLHFLCATLGCGCTHAATPDGRPAGVPGTKEVRRARHVAYQSLSILWERGWFPSKVAVYKWLDRAMGAVSALSIRPSLACMDKEQCEWVLELVDECLDDCLMRYAEYGERARYLEAVQNLSVGSDKSENHRAQITPR